MKDIVIEKENFNKTVSRCAELLNDTNLRLSNVKELYKHDFDEMMEEKIRLLRQLEVIKKSIEKPYFARIDFSDNQNNEEICYIGKVGLSDFDNSIITLDWRSPMSSLYYDSNVGEAEYKVPKGTIKGYLSLKRQFDIENGIFNNYTDVDTVSNDEMLKPYLNINGENRLKNIVATIQNEQNKIIREQINKNIIVQGVAGSGKTTVALHRIAYLVYNHRDIIKDNQYMVIGPNKFFVNYISSVLPDLDVANVLQFDLGGFAKYYIDEKFEIIGLENGTSNKRIDKLKSTLEFKKSLDKYIRDVENNLIPNSDFIIKGITILNREQIKKIVSSIDSNYSIKSKVDRMILLASKYIEDNQSHYIHYINREVDKLLLTTDLDELRKNRDYLRKEILANCNKSLRSCFGKYETRVINLYQTFIKNSDVYIDYDNTDELKEVTLASIKNKQFHFSDIASLLYLKYKLNGSGKCDKYKHLVIDEAQDYNVFIFDTLRKIFKNSTFSIYGDLAQSLYSHQSISNWEEVVNGVFIDNLELLILNKSYRTTIEIMNEANKINEYLGLHLALPVIRHGSAVEYIQVLKADQTKVILELLKKLNEKNYKTIAIISKTDGESKKVYTNLINQGIKITNIDIDNQDYISGICTITSKLSKGLEFDVVIINNVNDAFNSDTEDLKLLYVSMTRALHELYLVYDNKSIPALLN